MISRLIICAISCISFAKAQIYVGWGDYEEYYSTTISISCEVYEQDKLDADAIVKSKMDEKVFASILPYREKTRRMAVIREIGVKNGGVDYMTDAYIPQDQSQGSTPFKDLVFALSKDENIVLSAYLQVFFDRLDETWIIIAMVLTKDIQQMIATYDKYHYPNTFKHLRKKQKSPFENMLRVWVRENREPNEPGALDKNQVALDAENLKKENDSGGWKETRAQIENITIKKSIKYAQAVIDEFEKSTKSFLEDVILGNVQSHGLNHDLADTYSSLVRYIKNKHKYIAELIAQYSDGADKRSAWIMCLAVVCPEEWPKIDDEFKKLNQGKWLSTFILEKMTDDKVMAEMIVAVIYPNFKPTTFTMIPLKPGAGPESTPPPATPTTMAPPNPSPSAGPGAPPTQTPAGSPPSSTPSASPPPSTPGGSPSTVQPAPPSAG